MDFSIPPECRPTSTRPSSTTPLREKQTRRLRATRQRRDTIVLPRTRAPRPETSSRGLNLLRPCDSPNRCGGVNCTDNFIHMFIHYPVCLNAEDDDMRRVSQAERRCVRARRPRPLRLLAGAAEYATSLLFERGEVGGVRSSRVGHVAIRGERALVDREARPRSIRMELDSTDKSRNRTRTLRHRHFSRRVGTERVVRD